MCKSNDLYILNGRFEYGSFTTTKSGILNYFIGTVDFLLHVCVDTYQVMDFSCLYSDIHTPISCTLKLKTKHTHNTHIIADEVQQTTNIRPWSGENSELHVYRRNLDRQCINSIDNDLSQL
jgi:hypothetical protein